MQMPPALRYRNGRLKDLSPLPPPVIDETAKFKPPRKLLPENSRRNVRPFRGSLSKWIREANARKLSKK